MLFLSARATSYVGSQQSKADREHFSIEKKITPRATLLSMFLEEKVKCTNTIKYNNVPCDHGELASDNSIDTILIHFFDVLLTIIFSN